MTVKISSWNVCGIRSLEPIKQVMDELQCDIFCVQETKLSDFSDEDLIHVDGCDSFHSISKRGYSGTAIYAPKESVLSSTQSTEIKDVEGRMVVCDFEVFTLVNVYCPNGGKSMDYKFLFFKNLIEYIKKLKKDKKVIICGDFNICHNIDNHPGLKCYSEKERNLLNELLELGFVDSFRLFSNEQKYTCWSYKGSMRRYNMGSRLDYFFVDELLVPFVLSSEINSKFRGSDHCPITLVLNLDLKNNFKIPKTATNFLVKKTKKITFYLK